MKVAYLLGSVARYMGKMTGAYYTFQPWAEIAIEDWPPMERRTVVRRGCCGKPSRVDRVFGTEEEVRTGQVATNWR